MKGGNIHFPWEKIIAAVSLIASAIVGYFTGRKKQ